MREEGAHEHSYVNNSRGAFCCSTRVCRGTLPYSAWQAARKLSALISRPCLDLNPNYNQELSRPAMPMQDQAKPIQGSEIQAIGTNDPCYANGLLIESAEMLNGDTSGRLQASQWKPFLKSSTCWQKAQYQFNPASLDTLKSVSVHYLKINWLFF